jgi:hypothetical protein
VPPRGENPEGIELHTLMRWAIRNVGVEEGVIQSHVRKQAAVTVLPRLCMLHFGSRRVGAATPQ